MGRITSLNPLAFVPLQVTTIATATYLALLAVLLWVHTVPPPAPQSVTPRPGLNLTVAWHDLQHITAGYHPWGSARNDAVRDFLLARIDAILAANTADYKTVYAHASGLVSSKKSPAAVTVFANDTSNITTLDDWTLRPWTLYAESQNILVYIRGTEDPHDDWWNTTALPSGPGGVLVNAHYDSVSSGFGATDDGVGVVSVLQLISYFTTPGQRPRRGLVCLLNNGEENGLYGARAFLRHPLARLPRTFLNLEGAGAGGRAMLFRSTDTEITRAYAKSPLPFGSIVSGDGFRNGFVRSGTDYTIFTQDLGLRGLDLAFFEPRARYHTDQDDARDTSIDSLWHMLSASLATLEELTAYAGDEFEGVPDENGLLDSRGSDAVWFDLFGRAFAVLALDVLFAMSVALLTAGPILLIVLEVLLRRSQKWYPLANKKYLRSADDDEAVRLHGRRGFTRFPIAVALATGTTAALAFLLNKLNPAILYSSPYSVWAMLLSTWTAVAWFFFAGAANIRPTALHRAFVLIWLYAVSWVLVVLATVGEKNYRVGSGYFLVLLHASVFLALLVSYLEMFALPSQTAYVEQVASIPTDGPSTRPGSQSSRHLLQSHAGDEAHTDDQVADDTEATERTSLLRGRTARTAPKPPSTFTGYRRRHTRERDEFSEYTADDLHGTARPYQDEQAWSSGLPRSTWIIQFLLLVPINVILIGQVALLLTSSLHQTLADGNPTLPIYLFLAALTTLLLLPLTPFLHRFTYHVPTFLLAVAIGCLIYNLTAFPFSAAARMKFYFLQDLDLATGANRVLLIGLNKYLQTIISQLPSAAGQQVVCGRHAGPQRPNLQTCSFPGLAPNITGALSSSTYKSKPTRHETRDWLDLKISHAAHSAVFRLRGRNTKQCRLVFEQAVSTVVIRDGSTDPRVPAVPAGGAQQINLFGREFDKPFEVNVSWPEPIAAKGQHGRAVCLWADANEPGTIPAFDELRLFAPVWSAVSKGSDGLVEGWKEFEVGK